MPSEEPPDYDNPFPLEVDDPELGQMIVWFCEARPLKAGLFLTPDGVTDMRGNYPLFAAAGRNAPCPCGSRDKFKKCCASKWRGWAERDRQRLRDEQIRRRCNRERRLAKLRPTPPSSAYRIFIIPMLASSYFPTRPPE